MSRKRSKIFNKRLSRRRGIALILVLLVMAVASILAFAMLSASALQATAAGNAVSAAEAQAQAESGIHLAGYYLTHPDRAPVSPGAWGPTAVSFASTPAGTAMPGSATVTVATLGSLNNYSVISTGSVPNSSDNQPITKQITAQVEIVPTFQVTGAGAFNSNAITIGSGVTINGSLTTNVSPSITGTGVVNGAVTVQLAQPAPANGTVTDYSQPYYYAGAAYNPGTVSALGGNYGPTASNPLGIYYNSGNLTVTGALNVVGTLYVKNGTLTISSNKSVTINPVTGTSLTYSVPALVVDQAINVRAGSTLTVAGVVCTNKGITNTGANASTQVNVTGALLITDPSGAITNGSAKVTVTYNSAYTNVLDLVSSEPPAVKIISWSE